MPAPAAPLRLAVAGATGRMGRMLIEAALAAPGVQLAVALERPDSPALGRDCGEFLGRATGVAVGADTGALAAADVLIDFTRPEGSLAYLQVCAAQGVRAVVGTTGFDEAGRAAIAQAAQRTAIVFAPNMSVGVNAALDLVEQAARLLVGYDVEVIETHHRHKVDAPSGTALALGERVARALGGRLDERAVYGRHGITGARREGSIGFSAVRGGDIIGDHTVLFAGQGERIEITHRSGSRENYAAGALRAARFLAGRGAGLYSMKDVLAAG